MGVTTGVSSGEEAAAGRGLHPVGASPGEEGQVDFFDVTVEEGGVLRQAWKFVIRLMYSGRDSPVVVRLCDKLSFLQRATCERSSTLAVCRKRTIYDNLPAAAVTRRRTGVQTD